MEFETDNGRKKLTIEFSNQTAHVENQTEFEIKQKKNTKNTFYVEKVVDNNDTKTRTEFQMVVTESQATFNYKNGFTNTVDRNV